MIIAALLLLLTGCAAGGMPEEELPVNAEGAVINECAVYMDRGGYLVPVTTYPEWGEMYESISETLKTGLPGAEGVIPNEAGVTITAENGTASVRLTGVPEMEKEAAGRMINAVSATLLQFDGISSVSFEINGSTDSFCGNDISQAVSNVYLNPAYDLGDYEPFTVWYKTTDGLMLPVTKEAPEPSASVLVNAMIKEPKDKEQLESLFPTGTVLNSASIDGGTLSLDFNNEFYAAAATPGGEELLLTGINLTCSQLEGIEDVKITVNGAEYKSPYSFENTAKAVFSNRIMTVE